MTLEYWYLFPISVLIATTAMPTGFGGAVFFSPLFMLALRLEPSVAAGTALTTELFRFSSGLAAALAGRYKLERHLGEGGMATVHTSRSIRLLLIGPV